MRLWLVSLSLLALAGCAGSPALKPIPPGYHRVEYTGPFFYGSVDYPDTHALEQSTQGTFTQPRH